MAVIGLITSGLYLHFNLKVTKSENLEEEVRRAETQENDGTETLNNSSVAGSSGKEKESNGQGTPQLSKTNRHIMEAQIKQEEKTSRSWN